MMDEQEKARFQKYLSKVMTVNYEEIEFREINQENIQKLKNKVARYESEILEHLVNRYRLLTKNQKQDIITKNETEIRFVEKMYRQAQNERNNKTFRNRNKTKSRFNKVKGMQYKGEFSVELYYHEP